jgi:hypothetical protein
MQPVRYRPPAAALDILLMLSNYLRDLNTDSTGRFLAPHLKNVVSKQALENIVRANLREINTKAGEDDDLRLTLRLSMAQEMLEQLRTGAQTDPGFAEVLNEQREYNFNEFLPGGRKTLTLAGMLDELGETDFMGNAPCMNYVGGQVQDYLEELSGRPRRQ